jgi:hypothetical protein
MNEIYEQRRKERSVLPTLVLVGMLVHTNMLFGASHENFEIKPFGMLDTDASFSIRYLLDENDRSSDGSTDTFENRTTWEQELLLTASSYVYHPGFLNMDFAGGPLLVQQDFGNEAGSAKNDESLLNFLARLNFLELKSYPFSLYYQRSHPSITTSLSGRFLTQNDEYGFNGQSSLFRESTQLNIDLSNWQSTGSGFGTVVDEHVDRGSFRWLTSYRDGDRISLEYTKFTQDSMSGSTGLPIQESTIRQESSSVIARNTFGSKRQFTLDQSFFRLEQEIESTLPSDTDNLYYTATGRWQYSDSVRSSLDYRFNETEQTGADATSHDVRAVIFHSINDEIWYDLFADHEVTAQVGFDRDRTGIGGALNFSKPVGFGTVGLSASVRQERTDQESSADTVQVFDEPVTLNGTTPVDLANEFVVTTSVVVTNSAGTQVFVENVDYRLIVVGSITSIQRLIDGNIFDGQTIFVDYEYLTSGTAKFDTFSPGLNASVDFLKFFHAQVRYNLRDSTIISGELTTPINDQELFEVVLGADFPIGHSMMIGGEYRHLDQDEDISPFVRDSISFNASTRINGSLRFYASADLVQVDQEFSVEDVDQVTYRLGVAGRAFGRLQLSYETWFLEDTGGSLLREQLQHRLNIQGRYRQVRFFLRALFSEDTQGTTERDYTQVTFDVTRDF